MSSKKSVSSKELNKEKSVEIARNLDKNTIVNQFAETKMVIIDGLDGLTNKLIAGTDLLTEVETAIAVKKETLKEVNQIEVEADTLSKLLVSQEECRKQWKREQEDYLYDLKKSRDKENDDWMLLKEKRQREFSQQLEIQMAELEFDRKALEAQENELLELRDKVAQFPTQLAEAITAKEKEVSKSLHAEFNYKFTIQQKDNNAEIALLKQINSTQEKRIKELEAALEEARSSQRDAVLRVQSIAEKAIEGASKHQTLVVPTNENSGSLKK